MKDPAQDYAGKRVLITGASGFIGGRLAQRLAAAGATVIATGRQVQAGPWQTFLQWDIATEAEPHGDCGRVDVIFHLASKAHAVSERVGESAGYREVIVEGTRRVVAFAERLPAAALVYVSSVKAMGEGQGRVAQPVCWQEEGGTAPQTPYGEAKAEAEGIVRNSRMPFVSILRPTMVYGPGQKGNLLRMQEAVRRGRFPLLAQTHNRRSMVHVDDLLDALLQAALTPAANREVFIITGIESPSTRDLLDWMREAAGLPEAGKGIPMALLDAAAAAGTLLGRLFRRRMPLDKDTVDKLVGSAWYSSGRAESVMGYRPQRSLRDFILGK